MNAPKFTTLDIGQVKLDSQNPRIKQFLENYVGEPTSEQISLALSDSGTGDATTSYRTLRESIRVSKGIIHPIVVNHTSMMKWLLLREILVCRFTRSSMNQIQMEHGQKYQLCFMNK